MLKITPKLNNTAPPKTGHGNERMPLMLMLHGWESKGLTVFRFLNSNNPAMMLAAPKTERIMLVIFITIVCAMIFIKN